MEKNSQDKYVSRKEFYYALGSVHTMLLIIFTMLFFSHPISFDAFTKIFAMGSIAFIIITCFFKASKIHD